MKIYTKMGDQGRTTFFGCGMVQKNDPRIEAFGALDELNSVIGVTLCFIEDEKLRATLTKVQNDLFQLGADLAGSELQQNSMPRITEHHIQEMEAIIDEIDGRLGIPPKFILPGGTASSSFIHLCRATARRAERTLVGLKGIMPQLNGETLRYVNRLSDMLYMLARQANNEFEVKEQHPLYKYMGKEENK